MVIIHGSNFSGRSTFLREELFSARKHGPVIYLGGSIASSLSGLTTSLGSELALYQAWGAPPPPPPLAAYFKNRALQRLADLSGGEQVLVSLTSTTRPGLSAVGVDSALEQLDMEWRSWALDHLTTIETTSVKLIDNQLNPNEFGEHEIHYTGESKCWAIPKQLALLDHQNCAATDVRMCGINFRYPKGPVVFRNMNIKLEAGYVYRLAGANGSGKTTLLRLLCGVLPAQEGTIEVNGKLYRPHLEGNRLFALAMQNPDEQWTDVTIIDDFKRRLNRMMITNPNKLPKAEKLTTHWETAMGTTDLLRTHVLDLPRAMRKRLSWLWPLSGLLPWLVFDEPTLGQDKGTVAAFADAAMRLVDRGHGIIIVSHDERLMSIVAHRRLEIGKQQAVVTS